MLTWLILGCALGRGAPHQVDLAELAPLAPDGLAELRDEEHALAVARTQRAGTEAEQERAKGRIDQARERRKQADLELQVAQANVAAAEASQDASRLGTAQGRLQEARYLRDLADAAERWQRVSADAARAEVDLARARVDLREAELEMARLNLLEQHDRGRAYARSAFTQALREAQERYDGAQQKFDRAQEETLRAYDRWKALDQGNRG